MVAASKNFRTKGKQRQVIYAPFDRRSVASVALCEKFVSQKCFSHRELRGPQRNYWEEKFEPGFASSRLRGEKYSTVGISRPQAVWSAAYVNSPVLQDSFAAGVIQPNSRIYFLHDANWNTTAIVGYNATTQTWGVTQRYIYSPYGSLIVLNSDFSTPPAGTQPISDYLYQGMTLDFVTGLYYARNRNYSPSLGVWISQDPLQYVNGANMYQFVGSGPVAITDAAGLWQFVRTPGGGFQAVAQPGDTLGGLAQQVYGHASAWPLLGYQGNPSGLQIGTNINVTSSPVFES